MNNPNQFRKIARVLPLVLLALLLYVFFHQIVKYIYNSDGNIAAVLTATKKAAAPTPTSTLTPAITPTGVTHRDAQRPDEENAPGVPRGPSCPTGSRLLWENMAYEIDSRIANATASPATKEMWLIRGDHQLNSVWVKNPLVFTNRGDSPLDLTGISPFNENGQGQFRRAGTLISPRHVLHANHFAIDPPNTITFVDNNNSVFTIPIAATVGVGNAISTDIRVSVLESDVPSSFTHYPLIDADTLFGTPENPSGYFKLNNYRLPLLMFNQEDEAIVVESNSFRRNVESFIKSSPPVGSQRETFYEPLAQYDSGDADMMVINGKLAVVSTHFHLSDGPNFLHYRDLPDAPGVNDILEAVEYLTPGYQLETFDLSCFERNLAPVFSQANYIFTIPQNYTANTIVGRIPATDANTTNDILTYSLTGHQTNQFSIAANGDVRILQAGLLNPGNPTINFTGRVVDDWFSPMSDSAPISVRLPGNYPTQAGSVSSAPEEIIINGPEDTTPPQFSQTLYNFAVSESAENGTLVGRTYASDNIDRSPTYSIVGGTGVNIFDLNQNTGEIVVGDNSAPNFAAPYLFYVVIRAEDSSGNSATAFALINTVE